ncbi:quinone-dependent dihydroorotate dehydrogenase [Helicobacter jaachi]|uniref:Dihydroorotate dehydrogenase (quinone) n=1 Tax=Helicobacter jaachi TaxID=1677920 RepID=A0A4U8T5Q9_9HELI|nr:quinone-dependent dihydroorotate dehydrogenase [Helicobacter jaachi]TLD94871.1 quinone-dependent dihydroorotate dehydrogenase [Helicobacter jaachi]
MSIYETLSPYIFKLDAEKAHNIAEWALRHIIPLPFVQDLAAGQYCVVDEALHTEVAGMRFYNPVGLAAGFDKNATMIKGLSALGFGFLEIGTITQAPQEGNPKPRLFRHIEEKSLQNAMGFNNQGSQTIIKRLSKLYPYSIPLGINVGKNKIIAQSDSLKNYENVLLESLSVGDYFVFNLSSPNTPHLRDLQNVHFVKELFSMARSHTQKPLFLKISPDMDRDEMLKVVEMSIDSGVNGIIATNTTIDYSVLANPQESGGISGEALRDKSKEVLKILSEAFFTRTILISVGGIDSAQEAYERIKLGASLVQILSGLIFKGPSLCRQINEGLLELLKIDGFAHISQAIGQGIHTKHATKTSAIKTSRAGKKTNTDSITITTNALKSTKKNTQTFKTPSTTESSPKSTSQKSRQSKKSINAKSSAKNIESANTESTPKAPTKASKKSVTSTKQSPNIEQNTEKE